jgi:hypothetical protein
LAFNAEQTVVDVAHCSKQLRWCDSGGLWMVDAHFVGAFLENVLEYIQKDESVGK